jgi:alkaline phosphatase D
MANGIKIGEVTSDSAIIWTRLTQQPEANWKGKPFTHYRSIKQRPERVKNLHDMEGSVPGITGEVRVHYWPKGEPEARKKSGWFKVEADKDCTRQIALAGLRSGTAYGLEVEGRPADAGAGCRVRGTFRTAPAADTETPVRFVVTTCGDYPRRDTPEGHQIYRSMLETDPDFFVHTGDIEYYDKPAPFADTVALARFKWNRLFALPYQRGFHNAVASYFMKDDHDTLKNDCWPGQSYGDLTWEQGLFIFREQVPMGKKTYRTVRWGKHVQIWLVEGRDFRSPNTMKDGPEKSIWGEEQKQWFFNTVEASDATFRILISPTPLVGPDRGSKSDNHANAGFSHEGDELRSFIGKQKNMWVICGDRHWQYISEDPVSGVREYACGPASDQHAGGFRIENKSPMHRHLGIKGGFLSVEVLRKDDTVRAVLTHHGMDGSVYHQDSIQAGDEETLTTDQRR